MSNIWATHSSNCVFEYHSSKTKTGNFSSPGWPNSTYPNHANCLYRFRGAENEAIQLIFHTFQMEPPSRAGCKNDFIDIRTTDFHGINQVFGRYCGTFVPQPLISMHPKMEVWFKTDYLRTLKGFHATYHFIDESMLPSPTPSSTCGGLRTGVGGTIESPGFPNKYKADTHCKWLIRVSFDKKIFVKILELQLEGGLECNKAEMAVIDGYVNKGNMQDEKKTFCGDLKYYASDSDKTVESERNRLVISFETSKGAQGNKGFRLVWTEVSKDSSCPHFYCDGGRVCLDKAKKLCHLRTRYCIDPSLVCNGVPNCGEADDSDESSCYYPLMIGICVAGSLLILALIIAFIIWRRRTPKKIQEDTNLQLRQLEHSPSLQRNSRTNSSIRSLGPLPSPGYDIGFHGGFHTGYHSPRRGSLRRGHGQARASSPAEETFLHHNRRRSNSYNNMMNSFKPVPMPTPTQV